MCPRCQTSWCVLSLQTLQQNGAGNQNPFHFVPSAVVSSPQMYLENQS